jgi:hypothetical protein
LPAVGSTSIPSHVRDIVLFSSSLLFLSVVP